MKKLRPLNQIGCVVLFLIFGIPGSAQAAADRPTGERVTVQRAMRYDLTSRITGRQYRIDVSTPFQAEPDRKFPVFYVLDGNWYFLAATGCVTEAGDTMTPAIVVGIGYPTDDNEEVGRRRVLELTPDSGQKTWGHNRAGGGDEFIRVLLEEVKPFVEARYRIDGTQQSLYGKSLGGLMVLRALFRYPGAFQNYIAASPAIWWDRRAVLADEAEFSVRARAGSLRLRLLVMSASGERYEGFDPKLRERSESDRMIENAAELAIRLGALAPGRISVRYTNIPGETHVSASLAELGRALNFALKP